MATTTDIQEVNRALANGINQEARADPRSAYAGKFVGIANGKVVVVADDWDEVGRVLELVEPDPTRTCCLEASRDYSQIEYVYVWEQS
jgi:hypothetical protein